MAACGGPERPRTWTGHTTTLRWLSPASSAPGRAPGLPGDPTADEGPNAELTCTLLSSDCDLRMLELRPATGELSLQRLLSPQLTGGPRGAGLRPTGPVLHHHFAPSADELGATWRKSGAGAAAAAAAATSVAAKGVNRGTLLVAYSAESRAAAWLPHRVDGFFGQWL